MSVRISSIIWNELAISGNEMILLLCLADISNDQGDNIHPSTEYLTWKTGISESTIRRIRSEWREMGALIPIANQSGGAGKFVQYRLNLTPFKRKISWKKAVNLSAINEKGSQIEQERQSNQTQKAVTLTHKGSQIEQRNKEEPLDNRKREPLDKSKPSRIRSIDPLFLKAYDYYPRHEARGSAERAWPKAVVRAPNGEADFIYQRVIQFAAVCQRVHKDKQYIPHMATWLNQDRFLDDPSEWVVQEGQKNGKPGRNENNRNSIVAAFTGNSRDDVRDGPNVQDGPNSGDCKLLEGGPKGSGSLRDYACAGRIHEK